MILSRQLAEVKDHLHAGNNFWSMEALCNRLHDGQLAVLRHIIKADPSFFATSVDIDFVALQATYDLPLNARLGTRLLFTEGRQGVGANSPGEQIGQQKLRDFLSDTAPAFTNLTPYGITMQGAQVRVIPTPSDAVTGAIRVWFNPSFGNMIEGPISAAASSTTFALWQGAGNFTTELGYVDPRNDYYNGMTVLVSEGTGLGQVRTISDYVGSTGVFTVSSAFSPVLSTTDSILSILSPVPEDFHSLQVLYAALDASIKGSKRYQTLRDRIFGSQQQKVGSLADLLAWISARMDDQNTSTPPYVDGWN